MAMIRTALAGVGSCASSFLQLIAQDRRSDESPPGIPYDRIGGYALADVEIVTAFEVDAGKVGLELSKAIHQAPTKAVTHFDVEPTGVAVEPGLLGDGLDGVLGRHIEPHPDTAGVDVASVSRRLAESGADVLVCLLPTGSTRDVQAYAEAAANARVAFLNATPEPVALDERLAAAFARAGVPLLGDDLRSHVGATTVHTALIGLLASRGLRVRNTYQLNVGGNTDFLNLSDPVRSQSKVASKRRALDAAGIDASTVSAGPNGFVEHLGDTKVCFLRIEAESVLNSTVALDVRLEVEDSPNAAGVLASGVRIAKAAKDSGIAGVVDDVCPLLFKSPRQGRTEAEALSRFEEFVDRLDRSAGRAFADQAATIVRERNDHDC